MAFINCNQVISHLSTLSAFAPHLRLFFLIHLLICIVCFQPYRVIFYVKYLPNSFILVNLRIEDHNMIQNVLQDYACSVCS